ncbi:MAG: creatininase family protein [Solirubrobacteraceae bacterium]|nr:creatininase family protein [Solirubrobacteraceae bacterium]
MAERRYEHLHAAELAALVEAAPIAWVPIGTLEHHGPHLPFGVDGFTSHGLALAAAERAGGVVLPPTYLACGCLDLPFTLSFPAELVEATVRETVARLADRGFRVVVVLTGHGPLDLVHLLKRVCGELTAARPGLRAYGLCWLELNAAALDGPQEGEPRVIDHAALVETSWMQALAPSLVRLDRLSEDPQAAHAGVYGPNPRFTADPEWGRTAIEAAADRLAERARRLLDGGEVEDLADLRRFVDWCWPEPLQLTAAAPGRRGRVRLGLHNPGRASRHLSALRIEVAGAPVDPAEVRLVNDSPGETGTPVSAASLGPESGFYVRRGQTATIDLPEPPGAGPGAPVRLELGLAGVTRRVVAGTLPTTS